MPNYLTREIQKVSSFSIYFEKVERCLTDKRLEGLLSINCEEELRSDTSPRKIAFSDQDQTENPKKIDLN